MVIPILYLIFVSVGILLSPAGSSETRENVFNEDAVQQINCFSQQKQPSEDECRLNGCLWINKEEVVSSRLSQCIRQDYSDFLPGPSCDIGYVVPEERESCLPGDLQPIGDILCRLMNCTWCRSVPESGFPSCFKPGQPSPSGYIIEGVTQAPNSVQVQLVKGTDATNQFPGESERVVFEMFFESNERLRIKITDNLPRFEVPIQVDPPPHESNNTERLYDVNFSDDGGSFSFQIVRKSTGTILFDTSIGNLVFAPQYISMKWKPPTENVYGIGENEQLSFKHDFKKGIKYALWAADHPPVLQTAIYGVQPHYTVVEEDGSSHAVVLVNSNAQEFHMLPGPEIKYISTGGIFDMYFFLGPTPENTVQQFTAAFGRSAIPPYWSLGFHLCRWGYNTLENMKAAVDRMEQYEIPHDVQYGDIDIMENQLDFTYDKTNFAGLPEYIKELKSKGIKFVTILDPCISADEGPDYAPFTRGEEMDVWIKKSDGTPVVGRVWPRNKTARCYYPDYSKNSTREWWIEFVTEFHNLLEYDGIWIDMNEPSNFESGDWTDGGCENNLWNYPPYKPGYPWQSLFFRTLCLDHQENLGLHYNTHSLYGWFQSEPTLMGTIAGTKKRSLVLSRSTFLGSGRWTTHWLGDNWSLWSNLHHGIIGMMQFNLWGMPFVGPDICGFTYNSNAQLCQRWMQLGAFNPYSRNHNREGSIDQDPGVWGPEVATASKAALEIRYTLLPYLYSLFYRHALDGNAVYVPLWYNYPSDPNTYGVDRQFMWGKGLLFTPVLNMGVVYVTGYFPDSRVYEYRSGLEIKTRGDRVMLDAPMDFIPIHVIGGNIIPTQEHARNTEVSRNNAMGLIVALDDKQEAEGEIFFDDGDTLDPLSDQAYFHAHYSMAAGTLKAVTYMNGYADMGTKTLDSIRVLGRNQSQPLVKLLVNGISHANYEILTSKEILINGLSIRANSEFSITFVEDEDDEDDDDGEDEDGPSSKGCHRFYINHLFLSLTILLLKTIML